MGSRPGAKVRERTVQITLASLGDAAASLLLVDLDDVDLLEGLQDLAVDGARGVDVLGGAGATVLGGSVDLAKTTDTDGLAQVDGAGDSGGTDVEPVDVLGRHLLGGAGLDRVNPTCINLWLARGVLRMVRGEENRLMVYIPGMGSLP